MKNVSPAEAPVLSARDIPAAISLAALLLPAALAVGRKFWRWYRRDARQAAAAERLRSWRAPLAPNEVRASPRGVIKIGPPSPEQSAAVSRERREWGHAAARRALLVKPTTRNATLANRYGLTVAEVRELRRDLDVPYRSKQFRAGDGRPFEASSRRPPAVGAGPVEDEGNA